MSEHKQAGVAASVNSGMVMGGSGRPGRARLHVKLWSVVLCVVIVLGAGVSYAAWQRRSNPSSPATKRTASSPPADTSADQKAQYFADEGQYKSAEQSWQDKLDGTKDVDGKVAIYYQQSALAVQFKQFKDAKKYADKAKQLAPDSPTPYAALALLAEAQNNTPQAKQYWQQAINHVNDNMPGYNLIKADYQRDLDALK